ncbi:MAG: AraC family transcriptional regulator [Bryobacteraceae bacterium]|nr:MAG: AraC family transcriptional regulator [Bryobacteraceae bacterium]
MHAALNPQTATTESLREALARLILARTPPDQVLDTPIDGLKLIQRTRPTGPLAVTYEPSLAVVVQGRKQIELGGATIVYDPSRFLLTSLDLPVMSRVTEASPRRPYVCLALKLEMPVVRELAARIDPGPQELAARGPAMATGPVTVELLGALHRLVSLLDTPEDLPVMSPLVRREITYRILRSPAGARLRQIAVMGEESQRVGRAVEWIRRNFREPLRIADLAAMANMGLSTFHRHFRALTNMSPLQYQKKLRLQAARDRMLSEGLDVASAAFEAGYESVSQFTREYSRLFGRPPGRDVRDLRAAAARPLAAAGNV